MRLRAPRDAVSAAFASAGRPADRTPWREARWCAVDLELTGLDPRADEIIAIGAVPVHEGRLILGQSLYTLVRSSRRSEHGAILAHKLRVADLADAPSLDEAFDHLLQTLAGSVPVFHAAMIERAFLSPVFARRRLRLPAAVDTEVLGRLWLRTRDGTAPNWLPLAKLAEVLGQQQAPVHHALGDALTTAQAFVALAGHLEANRPQTVGSILRAGAKARPLRRLA
jgi:DNA polymerase-3 subunit epsilon